MAGFQVIPGDLVVAAAAIFKDRAVRELRWKNSPFRHQNHLKTIVTLVALRPKGKEIPYASLERLM